MINSSIKFVIVGPIGSKDGVLVQSIDLDSNLIGLTNIVYRTGQNDEQASPDQGYFQYLWGNLIDKTGRKQKVLLGWFINQHDPIQKEEANAVHFYFNTRLGHKLKSKNIQDFFNSFIEDAYPILSKLTEGVIYQEKHYEIAKTQLEWHISTLLLMCQFNS